MHRRLRLATDHRFLFVLVLVFVHVLALVLALVLERWWCHRSHRDALCAAQVCVHLHLRKGPVTVQAAPEMLYVSN